MNIFKHLISLILLLCGSVWATAANYRGDLNGDGKVDIADMVQWSKHMGASGSDIDPNFDLNGDGVLDDYDLDVIANLAINLKLTENSGFNVGIGGWGDSGEDFGGTVGGSLRLKASRAIDDFRFEGGKVAYDKASGNITRTIDIFGNESVIGVLVDIRLANGVNIDSESIMLSSDIISDHKIYGTPVIIDREWDDMQHFRFVIYSPSMSNLNGTGELFSFTYTKNPNSWDDSIQMYDCQAITKEDTSAFYYTSYYTGNWTFTPLNSIHFDEYVPSEGITLTAGDNRYMGLSFDPYDASNKEVECMSTDESVAIFNMGWNGIETFSPGEAIITVRSKDEPDISCSVKVIVQARIVKAEWMDIEVLDFYGDNLYVGTAIQLQANIWPEETTDKSVEWRSSDESIATVDENGLVNFLAPGYVTIYASTMDGSYITSERSFSCMEQEYEVTGIVIADAENGEVISSEGCQMFPYEGKQLYAIVYPDNATDKSVSWSSQNPDIANVDGNGYVYANSLGETVIIASANDGSGCSCQISITVQPRLVEAIEINPSRLDIRIGEEYALYANVSPGEATDLSLIWESSDTSVATVDQNGLVYGVGVGNAEIRAIANDGSGVVGAAYVTVNPILAESITIEGWPSDEIHVGDTFSLNAIVYPDNATDKSVTWISDDERIAIISADGEVEIVGEGSTSIRVMANDGSNCEAVYFIYAIAGINDVINDTLPFSIFNISGYLMIDEASKEDIESLPSGVYILVQGSSINKILK